jgi:Flp pilus assembly protein TadG
VKAPRTDRPRRGWRADERGVAALEFAFTVPVLLIVYLAGFELTQAMATNRKLSDATVELANVSTQYTSISALDANSIFNASAQIMAPYQTSNLTIVLTEIATDNNSIATVQWSVPYNGATQLPVGQQVTLPAGMAQPNICYILVQTTYQYTPTVGANFIGPMPLSDQIYMIPRSSPCIPYTG